MKKLVIIAAAASLFAGSAMAQDWLQQQMVQQQMLQEQQYQADMQNLGAMNAEIQRRNQNLLQQGLQTMRPQPYGGCTPYNRSLGLC
jgi:hypothetical protein